MFKATGERCWAGGGRGQHRDSDTEGRLRWLGRWGRCAVLLGEAEMKGGGADPVVPVVDLVVKKAGSRERKFDGALIRGHGVLQRRP